LFFIEEGRKVDVVTPDELHKARRRNLMDMPITCEKISAEINI